MDPVNEFHAEGGLARALDAQDYRTVQPCPSSRVSWCPIQFSQASPYRVTLRTIPLFLSTHSRSTDNPVARWAPNPAIDTRLRTLVLLRDLSPISLLPSCHVHVSLIFDGILAWVGPDHRWPVRLPSIRRSVRGRTPGGRPSSSTVT